MRIFLIGGKSGSGKGEVAKIIKEYYIYKLETCAITEYSKYLDVKEDINYSIMEIIKNENIKLAQDLRMYKEEK